MQIRESTENEKQAIRNIHQDAFGDAEGKTIAQLAIDLIEDKTVSATVSLVAEKDSKIVGHVIFTAVKVDGATAIGGYLLAPLAVANNFQGIGIGVSLIHRGLEILKQRDAEFVLVLGDPSYYSRAGFQAGHKLEPPYALEHPDAWMALELETGTLGKIKGTVLCAAPLNAPEHW